MTTARIAQTLTKNPSSLSAIRPADQRVMAFGSQHRWPFRILGTGPVPSQPVYHDKWWFVPIAQDSSLIPSRALERVRAIYEAGIRPKTFIVAHEAPQHLSQTNKPLQNPKWAKSLQGFAETSTAAAAAIGQLFKIVAIIGIVIVLIDPCLILVTEDNVWIAIDTWMTDAQ